MPFCLIHFVVCVRWRKCVSSCKLTSHAISWTVQDSSKVRMFSWQSPSNHLDSFGSFCCFSHFRLSFCKKGHGPNFHGPNTDYPAGCRQALCCLKAFCSSCAKRGSKPRRVAPPVGSNSCVWRVCVFTSAFREKKTKIFKNNSHTNIAIQRIQSCH